LNSTVTISEWTCEKPDASEAAATPMATGARRHLNITRHHWAGNCLLDLTALRIKHTGVIFLRLNTDGSFRTFCGDFFFVSSRDRHPEKISDYAGGVLIFSIGVIERPGNEPDQLAILGLCLLCKIYLRGFQVVFLRRSILSDNLNHVEVLSAFQTSGMPLFITLSSFEHCITMLFCYLVAEILQLRLWVYPRRRDQTRLWFEAPSRTREFLTNMPFYFRSPLAYESQSRYGEAFSSAISRRYILQNSQRIRRKRHPQAKAHAAVKINAPKAYLGSSSLNWPVNAVVNAIPDSTTRPSTVPSPKWQAKL
jgi:hypothetical protein